MTALPKPTSSKVVAQFAFTAVKEVKRPGFYTSFNMFEWNLFSTKWVKITRASGFGDLETASRVAKERSDEIIEMLANNQFPPPPIKG